MKYIIFYPLIRMWAGANRPVMSKQAARRYPNQVQATKRARNLGIIFKNPQIQNFTIQEVSK